MKGKHKQQQQIDAERNRKKSDDSRDSGGSKHNPKKPSSKRRASFSDMSLETSQTSGTSSLSSSSSSGTSSSSSSTPPSSPSPSPPSGRERRVLTRRSTVGPGTDTPKMSKDAEEKPKKRERRQSIGVVAVVTSRPKAKSKKEGKEGRERKPSREGKDDKHRTARSQSTGAQSRSRERTRSASLRSIKTSVSLVSSRNLKNEESSMQSLLYHLDDSETDLNNDDILARYKTRTTVDVDGKIRRFRKDLPPEPKKETPPEEPDATKSVASKRSKGSVKSMGSKRSLHSKSSRRLVDGEKRKKRTSSKRSDDPSVGSDENLSAGAQDGSKHVRTSPKRSTSGKDTVGSMPKIEKREKDVDNSKHNDSFSSQISDKSSVKSRTEIVDISHVKTAEMEKEVETLQNKCTDLEAEKTAAQADAVKLRKELREEKLELQRSHTERRELRSELREKENKLKEGEQKIDALEKAVESQLDKVEDLEDELRRANEEIFIMEEKLSHMESAMAENISSEGNGIAKEREFDAKRQQRLERRLEQKEKDLEERERILREQQERFDSVSKPQLEAGQLEEDNRMLLKALEREKAEADEALQSKQSEIETLKKELELAKTQRRSDAVGASGDGVAAELVRENEELQEKLKEEQQKAAALLEKKEDTIAFMEMEVQRLQGQLNTRESGDAGKIKRDLDATKAEAQVMKSKFEGAQRRNLILEDDIDHWKSVNCNLEDELAEWKAQAASWRNKYEGVVDDDDDAKSVATVATDNGILSFSLSRGISRGPTPAEISLHSRGNPEDGPGLDHEGGNAITNLWSKLTSTPQQKKQTVGGGAMTSGSLKAAMSRGTYH